LNNNKQWQNALCKSLNDFLKFLEEKIGNIDNNKIFNFYKILSFVLYNEYIKISFNDFRLLILDKILINQELMKNSSQIIKTIVENVVDSNPETMKENLVLIKKEESQYSKN